jgi:hypothetical protein
MVSRKEWYQRVNDTWPDQVPELTGDEAVRAARKLYRFVRGRKLDRTVKITSGRRYTWGGVGGVLYVNPTGRWHGPSKGWQTFVHDFSHWIGGGHSKEHARLEARLIREVIRRGWLNGALKSAPRAAPAEIDPRARRLTAIVVRLDRWIAKKKRAERAIAKLARSRRYYERSGVSTAAA